MSNSRKDFIRISKLFLAYKAQMFIAILCMIIAALCTGFHAWLVKPALDQVLINANSFYLYFIPLAILLTGIRQRNCKLYTNSISAVYESSNY
jgi:subfamily B ATP-binding cassette protein MsbA